jgi:Zn-dependent protease
MFWKLIDPSVSNLFIQFFGSTAITDTSFLFWLSITLGLLISIGVHEFGHAYSAHKLGDDTAKDLGRMTLNPISHFDALGLGLILFTFFGYGKPVPVNPSNFKNPVQGMMFVSLAGPLTNFLIAIVLGVLFLALKPFVSIEGDLNSIQGILTGVISTFVYALPVIGLYNIGLMIFNLLPIYPLDGSKIWGYISPAFDDFLHVYVYPNSIIILIAILFPIFGGISLLQLIMFPFIAVYTMIFGVVW